MIDIECGGSPTCVEVKYTTHSQGILSKVILQQFKYNKHKYGTFSLAFVHIVAIKILDIKFSIHHGRMKHCNTTYVI